MQSIRFDDGFKEFMINDDPNKIIRFDPQIMVLLKDLTQQRKNIK